MKQTYCLDLIDKRSTSKPDLTRFPKPELYNVHASITSTFNNAATKSSLAKVVGASGPSDPISARLPPLESNLSFTNRTHSTIACG